jgi:hypothetical protein
MDNQFCIVIFSHADSLEKEEILFKSLASIKKLDLKIILSSHIPVSERNQNICDYFIKDDNNLIISESDIFENPINIEGGLFNTTDYFGGIRLETFVYKKSYQAGVFNLFISALKLASHIGFKNAILWEYDYELGKESVDFFNESMDLMDKDNLESISFQSTIKFFNSDIVQSQIECCYAVPFIINIDKSLSYFPNKFIETGKEYNEISKLMIMEQWVKNNIINNCNSLEYSYDDYKKYLPDTIVGQVGSQGNNYLFLGLRSGIYFGENRCISSYNNASNNSLRISLNIFDNSNSSILLEENIDLSPWQWRYNYLTEDIFNMFNSDSGCRVREIVIDISSNKSDTFDYIINKNNIDFVSKLKKFQRAF